MQYAHRASGIPAVGSIPWGAHFCQFYQNEADLAETLIPFFKAGLEANEACLWITSDSLDAGRARSLLADAVPQLDRRIASGQLEIVPISEWYVQVAPRDVALADVMQMAIEQVLPFIEGRRHRLDAVLPGPDLVVHADPTRLAQVFGNLLHNAAKYTPEGGSVTIRAQADGTDAVVSVRDNGSGIPADQLVQIFELFRQLPRSLARSDGGLGIGLTLAKRVAEAHGGTITAHSDGPERGSEFRVRLVRVPAAPHTPA